MLVQGGVAGMSQRPWVWDMEVHRHDQEMETAIPMTRTGAKEPTPTMSHLQETGPERKSPVAGGGSLGSTCEAVY